MAQGYVMSQNILDPLDPRTVDNILQKAANERIDIGQYFGERYYVWRHKHDTGTHIAIWAIAPQADQSFRKSINSSDRLLDLPESHQLQIYKAAVWYATRHEFNNNGTIQGVQCGGPWVEHLQIIFKRIQHATEQAIAQKEQDRLDRLARQAAEHEKHVERFQQLFNDVEI